MAKKIDANKPIIDTDPLNNAYFQDRMFFATEYYTPGTNALQQSPDIYVSGNPRIFSPLNYFDSDFYNKFPSPDALNGLDKTNSGSSRDNWLLMKYHGKNLFDKFIGIVYNTRTMYLHFWSIDNMQLGQIMTAPRENWKYIGWINPAKDTGVQTTTQYLNLYNGYTQLEFNRKGDALYLGFTYVNLTTGSQAHIAGIYKIPLSTAWDTKSVTYVDPTEASLEIYHERSFIRGNNDGASGVTSSGLYDPCSIITGFSIDSNETEMRILSYARDQNYLYNQIYTIDDSPTFNLTLDSGRPQTFAKSGSWTLLSEQLYPDSAGNSSTGLLVTPDSYKKFPRLNVPYSGPALFPQTNYSYTDGTNFPALNVIRGGFNEDSNSLPALSYIAHELHNDVVSNSSVLSMWPDYALGFNANVMDTIGTINKLKIPGYPYNLEYGVDGIDSDFGDSGGIVYFADHRHSIRKIQQTHGILEKNGNYIHGPENSLSHFIGQSTKNLGLKTDISLIPELISLVDIYYTDSSGISSSGAQKNTLISQLLNSQ